MMINLCFCIDENYVVMLGAVLESIKTSNSHNEINIYVLSRAVSQSSEEKLKSVFSDVESISVEFIEALDSDVSSLEAGGHISSATYIRFEIPDLIPDVDKILYLDADLVVVGDLLPFWESSVDDYYAAAAVNPFFDRYKSLGMQEEWGYFNAGVLLINSRAWRANGIKSQALKYLRENKEQAIMFDQDALNAVFRGQWLRVHPKWNLQTSLLRGYHDLKGDEEVREAVSNPTIIHYSTSSKPWNYMDSHPMRGEYLRFERKFHGVEFVRNGRFTFTALAKFFYWRLRYILNGV